MACYVTVRQGPQRSHMQNADCGPEPEIQVSSRACSHPSHAASVPPTSLHPVHPCTLRLARPSLDPPLSPPSPFWCLLLQEALLLSSLRDGPPLESLNLASSPKLPQIASERSFAPRPAMCAAHRGLFRVSEASGGPRSPDSTPLGAANHSTSQISASVSSPVQWI